MFAQLVYPSGTTPSNVIADITALLTGSTSLSGLSAQLDVANSYLNAAVPGTWELVSTPTAIADLTPATVTLLTGASKVLRQVVSTKNTAYKFLKIAFANLSGAGFIIGNIGTGQTTGTLTGSINKANVNIAVNLNSSLGVGMTATTAAALTNKSIKVTIQSTAASTHILFGFDGGFYDKHALSVMDFSNNWNEPDPASYIPVVFCDFVNPQPYGTTISRPANDDSAVTTGVPILHIPSAAINSASFIYPNNNVSYIRAFPTTRDICFMQASMRFLSDPAYKFSGFKSSGTVYDIMPFGIGSVNAQSIASGVNYEDKYAAAIPYCDVTGNANVYLCNYYAFGQNGRTYQTPVGTMCKFGIFMVKVA